MKITLFGAAGAIGRSTVAALLADGHEARVVGRSRDKLEAAFGGQQGVEIQPADVADAAQVESAARGTDGVLYALGLPYTKKDFARYPVMMEAAVAGLRRAAVPRLVHISNVYPYGPPKTRPVTEEHPREPTAVKGQHRKAQEDVVLAAHGEGLETIVLRLPDFYGPDAENSLAHMIAQAAVAGKTADLLGPVDPPHEFIFTPDVGPVVVALFGRDDVWGEAYNVAGAGTITQRDFANRIYQAAGREPSLRILGPTMQRVFGLFMPVLRELGELSYLLSDPVILDDAKLRQKLPGLRKTPYDEGIRRTVAELQAR